SISGTISVTVNPDTVDEADETFFVALSNPVNAILSKGSALGTIVNDDGDPTLSINNAAAVNEGGTAHFTVTLSPASGQTVTVNYSTSDGTAKVGSDYTSKSDTLTFAPGATTQ